MTPEQEAYVRYRMERSRTALREARVLLDAGLPEAAVSRIYYAGFYAVSALILTEGHTRSKHTGVISLFNRDWVRTGIVPAELGRRFRHMLDHRQDADYKDLATFTTADVRQWLSEAESFAATISGLVTPRLSAEGVNPVERDTP